MLLLALGLLANAMKEPALGCVLLGRVRLQNTIHSNEIRVARAPMLGLAAFHNSVMRASPCDKLFSQSPRDCCMEFRDRLAAV